MSNNRWYKISGIVALFILMVTLSIVAAQGRSVRQATPEEQQAILETIARSKELEAQVAYTLDGSILAEVYINDPRGGELSEKDLELVQYIRQDKSLTVSDVGYLDFRQAVIAWRKQAIEKREAILARMQAEGREQMTPEESASLVDETGRVAIFGRVPDPATLPQDDEFAQFTILSIDMQGEVAVVVVDYFSFKAERILVQIDGRWYIAGGRTLQVTG